MQTAIRLLTKEPKPEPKPRPIDVNGLTPREKATDLLNRHIMFDMPVWLFNKMLFREGLSVDATLAVMNQVYGMLDKMLGLMDD